MICPQQANTIANANSQMQALMKLQKTSVLYMAISKICSTQNKTAKFHLTLYGSHMVDNLEGGLYFYFTTTQAIISPQKTKHLRQ